MGQPNRAQLKRGDVGQAQQSLASVTLSLTEGVGAFPAKAEQRRRRAARVQTFEQSQASNWVTLAAMQPASAALTL